MHKHFCVNDLQTMHIGSEIGDGGGRGRFDPSEDSLLALDLVKG